MVSVRVGLPRSGERSHIVLFALVCRVWEMHFTLASKRSYRRQTVEAVG